MTEPFRVTRTRTKRYVGVCSICDFQTLVVSVRANCAVQMRDHARVIHGMTSTYLNQYLEPPKRKAKPVAIKEASTNLPELPEGPERLANYADKLIVFNDARTGKDSSDFGKNQDVVFADVWVFMPDDERTDKTKGWLHVGDLTVWFKTVQKQIMEAAPDELAGVLHKGTDRIESEWIITPIGRGVRFDAQRQALKDWAPDLDVF